MGSAKTGVLQKPAHYPRRWSSAHFMGFKFYNEAGQVEVHRRAAIFHWFEGGKAGSARQWLDKYDYQWCLSFVENSTIVAQLKSCAADPGEAHVVISKNSGRREDVHVLNLAEIQ